MSEPNAPADPDDLDEPTPVDDDGFAGLGLRPELLASLAGVSRQTANEVLTELRRAGVVELRWGCLVVLDHRCLQRRQGGSRTGT